MERFRQEFIETYAKPGLPVIITGLNVTPKDLEKTLKDAKSRSTQSPQFDMGMAQNY